MPPVVPASVGRVVSVPVVRGAVVGVVTRAGTVTSSGTGAKAMMLVVCRNGREVGAGREEQLGVVQAALRSRQVA